MKLFNKNMPKTIWALGFVSLLMDTSSEIVHGLLPVFLISMLGTSYSMVGLIEGVGEASALVVKVFSGPLSDWWGKRKPLVILGYSMGAISKPLFALAPTSLLVFGARVFDRTGKGIRGAPRDALVADTAPPELRGEAFGLRQSLDTVGAFLGPLFAILLMSLTNGNYRLIFWLATIPGVLSVVVLIFGVKESEIKQTQEKKRLSWGSIREFRFVFWIVVIAGAIFQLARFSEAFLILRAQNQGLSLSLVPAILVAMNVVYSLSAYPIGWLSDRLRREWLLLSGIIVLILSDLVLGFGTNLTHVFVGVLLWGLHLGLTQGVLAALVADTSPQSLRGTAYGLFNLFSALALLLASGIAGILWDKFGPQATFATSAAFAFTGVIVLGLAYVFKKSYSKIV
ncbi:MAG: MFS transporter [Bdellovibrionaceae bacterium]|nr:MFS transporter [Pseudobdellovibrionaceae bacterium]